MKNIRQKLEKRLLRWADDGTAHQEALGNYLEEFVETQQYHQLHPEIAAVTQPGPRPPARGNQKLGAIVSFCAAFGLFAFAAAAAVFARDVSSYSGAVMLAFGGLFCVFSGKHFLKRYYRQKLAKQQRKKRGKS